MYLHISGTGKSTTCVELMKKFVEYNNIHSDGKVLYCAPSNKAVNVGACELLLSVWLTQRFKSRFF